MHKPFEVDVDRPLPPKLKSIIEFDWEFPVDFPVVNNNTSPDATRALKAVIVNSIQNYYYDHRIYTFDVPEFTRHFENHLYNEMAQHQYWIDQYLNLIDENQFFYNDEEQNFEHNTSSNSSSDGFNRNLNTPQGVITNIDQHVTDATKTTDDNTTTGSETEHNTIHKSTLGDITVQFRNFAEFPNFIDKLIKAVKPCFIGAFTRDYDVDEGYIGWRFERATEPNRTLVYDYFGNLLAELTDGAQTMTLKGPQRTFTESSQGVTDTFSRTNVDGFGRAEAGGKYFITESIADDFAVSGGIGTMTCDTVNASRRATLTQTNSLKKFGAQVKIKTDKAAEGAGQDGGITFGYVDLLNHYEAVLRFSSSGTVQVGIIKKIDGDTNNIGNYVQVAATRNVADWWRLKMSWDSATGQIKVKAWVVGDPEPGWQKEEVDTLYNNGRVGLRSILNPSTTNAPVVFSYDDFIAPKEECAWVYNPTVVHDRWVRFLPYQYNNVNDLVLVKIIRQALDDNKNGVNDLLAESMRYLHTGDLDAGYGPTEVDGIRQDGSDWNDYLNQTGYYPETAEAPDPPEPAQLGCVDCSGWTRLLLKTFGFSLSLYVFDSIHVPRESKDIMDYSPGVYLIEPETNVQITDFTKFRVGDIIGFDADLTDPEEGQQDHLGFYWGVDTQGKRRFISSRSTPNGPTFADLGGKSVIDGTTNLYTRSIRSLRRI